MIHSEVLHHIQTFSANQSLELRNTCLFNSRIGGTVALLPVQKVQKY